MKAIRGRCACTASVIVMTVIHLSGCAVGSKSFSIDSNSRIPFFGLELKERKPKSSAPAYRSIGRSIDDGNVKILLQVLPGSTRMTGTTRTSMASGATSLPGIQTGTFKDQSTRTQLTESIPLPRTNSRRLSTSRNSQSPGADFQ